jgi:hypothetical protein
MNENDKATKSFTFVVSFFGEFSNFEDFDLGDLANNIKKCLFVGCCFGHQRAWQWCHYISSSRSWHH